MLLKMGFARGSVAKIMDCVQMVKYVVEHNMRLSNVFCPSKGLR